uniref:Uncharacterized protein n=1 Tax=Tanacetum cinerariifolium TaxID=118510 RepID=A0A6L2MZV7_TANCI|nr:hypothetical protein [Tanacetum cinerariifolium]
MFDADKDLQGEEVVVEQEVVVDKEPIVDATHVSAAATTVTIDDITLAKALEALKPSKPKIRGIVIKDHEEPSESRTTITMRIGRKHKMIPKPPDKPKKHPSHSIKEDANLSREEQQELNEEEKAKLFMELLEKKRKLFAAKRAEEKRNTLPTKAQRRSLMCTNLKNIDGWKPKALKNISFIEIQELFDKAMKRINNFIDFRTELVEESIKKTQA